MSGDRWDIPEEWAWSMEVEVRVTDLNYGGHVGNVVFLAYLQEARERFLREHGLAEADVGGGAGLIMTEAHVRYSGEVFLDDRLTVSIAVDHLRRARFDFVYRVSAAGGREVARARTVMAVFDYRARKLRPIPPELRALNTP
ncbi:bifunctional 3-hydroxyacyl-CoA dehydrogenase/thioesterase [Kiritimatiella glycovorans]|uniref:Bifunctional 3-hydroxyacyl-CoA dehydrogenase/thioesterase n=2 Tax=Kiritimatiella glycovorans TaxID=1307763 RepID=A0A0G3EEM7_9BACT|nr:bifunctional 3-hydroxyacyl-CoA dehydrogenase/thioesterase [Kiritimatiella glycovorans]